jgi:hypothetical protein
MNAKTAIRATRCTGLALLFGALGQLGGCASTGQHVSGFDQLTLAPGDTGTCISSPCQVNLKMPAGTGSYEVTGNGTRVGTFPAGQTVFLGSFWSSQGFKIEGLELPQAYAYIPSTP